MQWIQALCCSVLQCVAVSCIGEMYAMYVAHSSIALHLYAMSVAVHCKRQYEGGKCVTVCCSAPGLLGLF